jgi:hypothetical protein
MLQTAETRQILIVSSSAPLARAAADVLRQHHAVEEVRSAQEASAWLGEHRADLAVVEVDLRELAQGKAPPELLSMTERTGTPMLALIRCHEDAPLKVLLERSVLPNFIAAQEGQLDPFELSVTVAKLFGQDIFGLEQYLAEGASWKEFTVTDSSEREPLIRTAHDFALTAGCHPRVAERVSLAADELLSNAIYNAPADGGQPRFAAFPRTMRVTLEPGEVVRFRLGTDGKRLAVAATDPFGSLSPATVLHYLAKCFAGGEDQIDEKPGGAGLGLYSLFNLLHHFVINIEPGRRTEAIGLLEVSRSYRRFAARPKSLNIFVSRSR